MSPGGGLLWHLRALRYRRHWGPFRTAITQWLATWPHGREHLLLLGPSAGWCLPTAFLTGFRTICAVDLDPLAPWLFNRLHGAGLRRAGVRVRWQQADIFDTLVTLLRDYPEHAVLFGNMLGQHRFYCSCRAGCGPRFTIVYRLTGRPTGLRQSGCVPRAACPQTSWHDISVVQAYGRTI